jgi:hypothetical protein
MVNPVNPNGTPLFGGPSNVPPMGPPLPADNPWVQSLAQLFPNVPIEQIQMYAAQFQANMFSALNNQIAHDAAQAKEAARKAKEAIEDNG